jgi:transposase
MSKKSPTLRQFQDRFPTEESCLEHLMRVRFGDRHNCEKCGKDAKFYRVKARRSYACEHCGAQVYPTAGTPFDRTRTSLRDWFFVMFQFCASRNGVAAKEVERQLGVTYKTAWRMCHEIRKYMGEVDGDAPLGGPFQVVEIDETFLGGETDNAAKFKNKDVVFGMLQRGGNIITRAVPDRKSGTVMPLIAQNVKPFTRIHSDEWIGYSGVGAMKDIRHDTVRHNKGQYVSTTGVTVNALEGFWSQLKRGINGTHIHVSAKHLQKYLGEFEFRYNRRGRPETMLGELMVSFRR